MKALLKNLQGTRRVILICTLLMMVLILIAYHISGDNAGVIAAIFVSTAAFSLLGTVVVANEFQIKKGKVFVIYFSEVGLIGVSILMPLMAIFILITLVALVSCLLAESRLCLWLRANPPPSLLVERMEMVGTSPFRQAQVVFHDRRPNTWRSRVHWKLYSLYSQ